MRERRCFWILALLLIAGEARARPAGDPWERFHAFRRAGTVELESAGLGASDADAARTRLAARVERSGRRLLKAGETDPAALRIAVRLTAGPADAQEATYGLERLRSGGFRFHGEDYVGAGDGLLLTIDDPNRGSLPLTLVVANRASFAARLVGALEPTWHAGFTTFRGGELERRGALAGSARPATAPFERFAAAPSGARGAGAASLRRLESAAASAAGVEFFVDAAGARDPKTGARAAEYLAATAATLERVGRWVPAIEGALAICAHTSGESLHAARGVVAPFSLSELNPRVHVALLPDVFDDAGAGAAAARARAALGAPAVDALLEAVGVEAADRWWGQALEPWVAHLVQAGLGLGAAELMAHEVDRPLSAAPSPHRIVPQLALWVRYVFEVRGAEGVRALWRGELDVADSELASGFARRQSELATAWAERLEQRRAGRRRAFEDDRLRRGVAFLPGDVSRLAGYASSNARLSLDGARAAGANAVTLDVHAYDRLEEPRFAIAAGSMRTNVGDFELSAAAAAAMARDMSVLLKPHLLASPSGAFLGQTAITQVDDWGVFFGRYAAFLEHYALLGELLGVEVLSIGSALPRATRTLGNFAPEDLPARDRRRVGWTELCASTRRLFSGGLTYAALDGMPGHAFEVVGIEFWDQLDFVGVEVFGPPILAQNAGLDEAHVRSASDETLMVGIRARMARADREARDRGMPVLFTAIGFPATTRAAGHPASVTGELDLELQRRSYAGLSKALAQLMRAENRIAGFYLWSWSADPNAGGLGDRGHSPQNKPAEAVLEQLLR